MKTWADEIEVKNHRIRELEEQIAEAMKRNERMKRERLEIEEIEASVCPEDVSFFEYINRLEGRIAALTAENERLAGRLSMTAAIADYREAAIRKIPDLGEDEDYQVAVARVVAERDALRARAADPGRVEDVEDIVEEYLRAHGFDGLHNPDAECGCEVCDLAPCGEMSTRCCPGYLFPCDCGEHDFHIGTASARDHYYAEHQDDELNGIGAVLAAADGEVPR